MAKVICLDSWISTLTEGKDYVVLATQFPYVCIVDDMGRVVWEYSKLFTSCSEEVIDDRYKYEVNWEVI